LQDISALVCPYTVFVQDVEQDYSDSMQKAGIVQKLVLSFLYLLHESNRHVSKCLIIQTFRKKEQVLNRS